MDFVNLVTFVSPKIVFGLQAKKKITLMKSPWHLVYKPETVFRKIYAQSRTIANLTPSEIWRVCRGGSRAAATSRMECFVIVVDGFQPLTIITKRSILDVAAVLDPRLVCSCSCSQYLEFTNQLINDFHFQLPEVVRLWNWRGLETYNWMALTGFH